MSDEVKIEMVEEPEKLNVVAPQDSRAVSTADFPISDEARRIEAAVIARELQRRRAS